MFTCRPILRIISAVLVCAFTLSGMPSYAVTDVTSDFALAPPSVTQSQGNTLLRDEWIIAAIGKLIYPILKQTQDGEYHNPTAILIPHIKKNVDMAEVLLRGLDIDGIEEVRERQIITGFSLPVTKHGSSMDKLVYNLQGGNTAIQMGDGTKVYARMEIFEKATSLGGISKEEKSMILHELRGFAQSILSLTSTILKHRLNKKLLNELNEMLQELSKFTPDMNINSLLEKLHSQFSEEYIGLVEEMVRIEISPTFEWGQEVYEREKILKTISLRMRVMRLYSGYYAGKETRDKQYLRLNDVLTCYPAVKQRLIETVAFDLQAGDIFIYTDEVALFQVMGNLLRNANEATADGRENKITIRTYLSEDKNYVFIQVEDHGVGISKENLPKIFTPHFTTKDYGKGLGLAIVKDLIETRCDGTISVQSELGKSTTFTLRLPIVKQPSSGQTIRLPIMNETGGGTKAESARVPEQYQKNPLAIKDQGGVIDVRREGGTEKIEAIPQRGAIDKSSIVNIFPHDDYLDYLILNMTGHMLALNEESEDVREGLESLHQRLSDGLNNEFVRMQKSSSNHVRGCYLWFAQLIKYNLGTAKKLLPLVQDASNKEIMANGVPDAENFANGMEMLLDESEKQVDINDTLEKMLNLTFSNYYRERGREYVISKQLSSGVPAIFARQDDIAYLFFSLILPLRRTKEVTLTASTQLVSDKERKYIEATIRTPQEISLENVFMRGKDTDIGFELAKRIARNCKGTVDVQSEAGKGTTFTIRLPIALPDHKTGQDELPVTAKTKLKKFILEGNVQTITLDKHAAGNLAFMLDLDMASAGVGIRSLAQSRISIQDNYDLHNVRRYKAPVVSLIYFQGRSGATNGAFMLLNDDGETVGYGISSTFEGKASFRYQIFKEFRGQGLGDPALKVILYALYRGTGEDRIRGFIFHNYFMNREIFDAQVVLPGFFLKLGFVEY